MNDEQFGLGLKISIVITIIILIAGIILVINVLKNEDTSSSILDEMTGNTFEAQIENDDEFKQYLQVFALSIQEERPIKAKNLETVIGFLNQIYWYQPITTENGFACYEEQIVKKVAIELLGSSNIETSEEIILDKEYKAYRYAEAGEFLSGKCMDIVKVSKKDNIYEIEYKCTFPSDGELYELSEGKEITLSTYNIKATIQQNEDYEYAKYYLKNIELLSKDIVKYN